MKLGVLTVGSDAPGLNAVIRAVVRTALTRYQADVFGISQGFLGLLRPPEFWPLSPADVIGLARRGGTILGCNRSSPFDVDGEDRSEEILETIRWLGIDGLIVIGGEGSLVIAERLTQMGVKVVCIPKTIENDLPGTSVTFGYATAVELATSAIDNLQTTSESVYRVMVLEVAGQRAGWIALTSGMAGGADVVLIPEIEWEPERVRDVILERRSQGKRSTIVVVAEGAVEKDAAPSSTGAAQALATRVGGLLPDVEFLVTILGHLQRGGDPNSHDRVLATRVGSTAVRAACEGNFGQMITINGEETSSVPLADVINTHRRVAQDAELVWTASSLGICLGNGLG